MGTGGVWIGSTAHAHPSTTSMDPGVASMKAARAAMAPSLLLVEPSPFGSEYAPAWTGAPSSGEALAPTVEENILDRYLARIATPQNSSCEPGPQNPFCLNNLVTDQQIVSGLTTSLVVGVVCLIAFIYLREKCKSYEARLYLPEVLIKPPRYPGSWLYRAWAWLIPVFTISDAELVRTCGLDAVMFHRAITFGVLFFLPVTVASCLILLPIYINSGHPSIDAVKITSFQQLTLSNVNRKGGGLWAPFVFVYLALLYAFWLLLQFYEEYVKLHQHYLTKGEDVVNEWSMCFLGGRRNLLDRVRKLPNIKSTPRQAAMTRLQSMTDYVDWLERSTVLNADEDSDEDKGSLLDSSVRVSKYEQLPDGVDVHRGRARFYKWWDTTTTLMSGGVTHTISAKPPVPFRKVVTTTDKKGQSVSVNAANYVVLVRDVPPATRPKPPPLVETPSMKKRASSTAWGLLGLLGQLCGGPLSGYLTRSFENDVDLAPHEDLPNGEVDEHAKAEELQRKLITKSISVKQLAPHFDIKVDQTPIANLLHHVLPSDRQGIFRRHSVTEWWQSPHSPLPAVREDEELGERASPYGTHRPRRWRTLVQKAVRGSNPVGNAQTGRGGGSPISRSGSMPLNLGGPVGGGSGGSESSARSSRSSLMRSSSLPDSSVGDPRGSGTAQGPGGGGTARDPGGAGTGRGRRVAPLWHAKGRSQDGASGETEEAGPSPPVTPFMGAGPNPPPVAMGLSRVSMAAPLARPPPVGEDAGPQARVPSGPSTARMRDYVGPRDVGKKRRDSKFQPRLFATLTDHGRTLSNRSFSAPVSLPQAPQERSQSGSLTTLKPTDSSASYMSASSTLSSRDSYASPSHTTPDTSPPNPLPLASRPDVPTSIPSVFATSRGPAAGSMAGAATEPDRWGGALLGRPLVELPRGSEPIREEDEHMHDGEEDEQGQSLPQPRVGHASGARYQEHAGPQPGEDGTSGSGRGSGGRADVPLGGGGTRGAGSGRGGRADVPVGGASASEGGSGRGSESRSELRMGLAPEGADSEAWKADSGTWNQDPEVWSDSEASEKDAGVLRLRGGAPSPHQSMSASPQQEPADMADHWERSRKLPDGGASVLSAHSTPDEPDLYIGNGHVEDPTLPSSQSGGEAPMVDPARTGFESWSSVRSRAVTPFSSQYDWKDAPERAGDTAPEVPASVFTLMQPPWDIFGSAVRSNATDLLEPRSQRLSQEPSSIPNSPTPDLDGKGRTSEVLQQLPSQPIPAAAAQQLPSTQVSANLGPQISMTPPSDIQSSSEVPGGLVPSSRTLQPPIVQSTSTESDPTSRGSLANGRSGRGSSTVGSSPGSPSQGAARVQNRTVSARRVPGWGDPFVAPPIAWPPAGRTARESTSPQSDASQTTRADTNSSVEQSGEAADAAGHRRNTTENEEFFDPSEEPLKGGKEEDDGEAGKEQSVKWNVLSRFMAWRSKYYDAREEWILDKGPQPEKPQKEVEEEPETPWEEQLGGEALVHAVFKKLFPENFLHVLPIRNHKVVDLLLYEWNDVYGYLEHAEALYEASGCTKRPRHHKFYGIWGPKVDSINCYAARIRELEDTILAKQQEILQESKDTPSFFVFFNCQKAAAEAAQCELFPEGSPQQFLVNRAPGPEQVNWVSLWLTRKERFRDNLAAIVLLAFFILLPIGLLTGAFQNINFVICNSDLRQSWYCATNNYLRGIIEGWLPSVLLMLWQNLVMPLMIYRGVMLLRKDISLSGMDKKIFQLFFIWDIFNVLLGGILGGSTLQTIPSALENPGIIYTLIGKALASSSNFFINYIMVQALMTMPYRMVLPTVMPLFDLCRVLHILPAPMTRRERTEYLHPPFNIRLGRELGCNLMLIYVMALSFAVVSPIILPFTLLFFLENWVVWRYQMLYAFERSYESGGILWHQTFSALLWSLFIFVFFTGCVLITNEGIYQGAIMIFTGPLLIYWYYRYMAYRFGKGRNSAPLLLANDGPMAHVDPAMYIPPALRPGAAGWFPEYGKAWENWCVPAYFP
eukprot:jgi/Botrbrau1/9106/Bobra.0305s0013.1